MSFQGFGPCLVSTFPRLIGSLVHWFSDLLADGTLPIDLGGNLRVLSPGKRRDDSMYHEDIGGNWHDSMYPGAITEPVVLDFDRELERAMVVFLSTCRCWVSCC